MYTQGEPARGQTTVASESSCCLLIGSEKEEMREQEGKGDSSENHLQKETEALSDTTERILKKAWRIQYFKNMTTKLK